MVVDGLTESSVGDAQLLTWAFPGALAVVQFRDDPGWSGERVWSWPLVTRSGDVCGFAAYTPGGDEYVEALAECSFYAQITRQRNAFAYPAEADSNVVQFTEVISDGEMVRLIQVGRGLAESGQATMGWSRWRLQQMPFTSSKRR